MREGDWQCPNEGCINHVQFPLSFVYGSKINCPKCGTGKSAQKAGDWCCPNPQCMNHQNTVYGSKFNCNKCGAPKPDLNSRGTAVSNPTQFLFGDGMASFGKVAPSGPATRIGDWHCPNPGCKNHTDNVVYASKCVCPLCGTDKPPEPTTPLPEMTLPPYVAIAAGFGLPGRPGGCQTRPGDWHCPNPACKNHTENVVFAGKEFCPICGTGKPAEPMAMPTYSLHMGGFVTQGGRPGGRQARPGDWHCSNPTCKNHTENIIFAGKDSCPICGMGRTDYSGLVNHGAYVPGPSTAPSTSGVAKAGAKLGQPGDWHCVNPACKNHTTNVVFASKVICPICNTPKPAIGLTVSAACRPGDWQCPNQACKNHVNGVYASQTNCKLCGSANPGYDRARSRSPHAA